MPFFDVFILSFNRSDVIEETIRSLVDQTFKDISITVLDNGSTDETVTKLSQYPVKIIQQESNIGFLNNFLSAKNHGSAPWMLLFHDDDILHPRYLEEAYELIKNDQDISLIGSNFLGTDRPHADLWGGFNNQVMIFKNKAHFTSFCYTSNTINFASAIYKRTNFNNLNINFDRFGKICDRPILIEFLGSGKAVVLKFPFIQYRIHAGQDSQTSTSGPFLKEAIALTEFYKHQMGDDWATTSGKCFILDNRSLLKYLYKWCSDRKSQHFHSFIESAIRNNAGTPWSRIPRPIMRFLKKFYLRHETSLL
jgi:glycosyltransferase involved in cell wall biosynthesis